MKTSNLISLFLCLLHHDCHLHQHHLLPSTNQFTNLFHIPLTHSTPSLSYFSPTSLLALFSTDHPPLQYILTIPLTYLMHTLQLFPSSYHHCTNHSLTTAVNSPLFLLHLAGPDLPTTSSPSPASHSAMHSTPHSWRDSYWPRYSRAHDMDITST